MKKQVLFISAECSTLSSLENHARTTTLISILSGFNGFGTNFNYQEAEGVYKGTKEVSFAVVIENFKQRYQLTTIAKWFNQESVLVVDGKARFARICFLDGVQSDIKLNWFNGKLSEDYTKVGGNYYTALPTAPRRKGNFAVPYSVGKVA